MLRVLYSFLIIALCVNASPRQVLQVQMFWHQTGKTLARKTYHTAWLPASIRLQSWILISLSSCENSQLILGMRPWKLMIPCLLEQSSWLENNNQHSSLSCLSCFHLITLGPTWAVKFSYALCSEILEEVVNLFKYILCNVSNTYISKEVQVALSIWIK